MGETNDILVSACLLGEPVRYDGTSNEINREILEDWRANGRVVPFCPEVAGGLGTPRPAAEIVGGTGQEVLGGEATVETEEGTDVTDEFLAGARRTLAAAREADVRCAILKSKSPSCGSETIYDGTFSGSRRGGRGVTAALLERHDIPVFSEKDLLEARRHLTRLSRGADP